MRLFKKIDFCMQLLLIIGGLIFFAFNPDLFFWPYLLVGGWQLFSTLLHLSFPGKFIAHRWRRIYNRTLLVIFIILCISFITQMILLSMFALLFVSPGLAAWYAFTCSEENDLLARKELVHLK